MAGYCFRCDGPAEGEACHRCGSPLYREQKPQPAKRDGPMNVGEDRGERPGGPSLRVIATIVTIALLLGAIAVAAASSFGIS